MVKQPDHVMLDMVSSSLPNQGDHLQTSLDDDLISVSLKGTTFSSCTSVCMLQIQPIEKERVETLLTLHK
jgi:hypothetical protein